MAPTSEAGRRPGTCQPQAGAAGSAKDSDSIGAIGGGERTLRRVRRYHRSLASGQSQELDVAGEKSRGAPRRQAKKPKKPKAADLAKVAKEREARTAAQKPPEA